jgi:hypothetical protein
MGMYEGFIAARKLFGQGTAKSGVEHFQIRPIAESGINEDPALPLPAAETPSGTPAPPFPGERASAAEIFGVPAAGGRHAASHSQETYDAPLAPAPHHPPAPALQRRDVWHDQYDRSLNNIQDHIHAVAGAVAMLDAVEHKMIAIKLELQRINDAGLMIDGNKVLAALQTLADYVNQSIESVDDQCVNMLRDARLDIRFAEMETRGQQSDGVALTMISLDRLLDFKIKAGLAEGLVADETPEFVDDLCAIISSNIQVLTSIMLALFASRDYTQAVTKLATRERIIPALTNAGGQSARQATIDQLQLADIDQHIGARHEQLQQGRASLTALLKDLRENRGDVGASFG